MVGAHRAELRLGRRPAWRCWSRWSAASRGASPGDRQLLGRPRPLDALHPAAALASSLALVLVSQGVVRPSRPPPTARLLEPRPGADGATRLDPDDRPRPGRVAGRDQAARHQRRRLLQRQLRAPASRTRRRSRTSSRCSRSCSSPPRSASRSARWSDDRRQGWALLAAMLLLFVPLLALASLAPSRPATRSWRRLGVDQAAGGAPARRQHGGQGGPLRRRQLRRSGPPPPRRPPTARSTPCTTATRRSAGSSRCVLMQLGEVVFGGVGSGLYGMLDVRDRGGLHRRADGRAARPEYLGKKIEALRDEDGLARDPGALRRRSCSAPRSRCVVPAGLAGARQPGRARLQRDPLRVLLRPATTTAAPSAASPPTPTSTTRPIGLAMLVGRYWVVDPGRSPSPARSRARSTSRRGPGTLPTARPALRRPAGRHVVILVGALTFLPALALGPIVEHLQLCAGR